MHDGASFKTANFVFVAAPDRTQYGNWRAGAWGEVLRPAAMIIDPSPANCYPSGKHLRLFGALPANGPVFGLCDAGGHGG